MDKANIHLTDRALKILRNAEREAQLSKTRVLQPGHLLLACLNEKTGALRDIYIKCDFEETSIRKKIDSLEVQINQQITNSQFFNIAVTEDIVNVMEVACNYMKGYNQIYINEGHLLKALLTTNMVDPFLTEENRDIILTLGTTQRDMITHLGNYTFPEGISQLVRKVNKSDESSLVHFIEINCSYDWSQTIKEAFRAHEPNVYIAINRQEEILGFAAYDVYKSKKGYFGPMGVSVSSRTKGIGYSLLHHCLQDMKKIGYGYAIIGGAGPIEYYEKACDAVVIPAI